MFGVGRNLCGSSSPTVLPFQISLNILLGDLFKTYSSYRLLTTLRVFFLIFLLTSEDELFCCHNLAAWTMLTGWMRNQGTRLPRSHTTSLHLCSNKVSCQAAIDQPSPSPAEQPSICSPTASQRIFTNSYLRIEVLSTR